MWKELWSYYALLGQNIFQNTHVFSNLEALQTHLQGSLLEALLHKHDHIKSLTIGDPFNLQTLWPCEGQRVGLKVLILYTGLPFSGDQSPSRSKRRFQEF